MLTKTRLAAVLVGVLILAAAGSSFGWFDELRPPVGRKPERVDIVLVWDSGRTADVTWSVGSAGGTHNRYFGPHFHQVAYADRGDMVEVLVTMSGPGRVARVLTCQVRHGTSVVAHNDPNELDGCHLYWLVP